MRFMFDPKIGLILMFDLDLGLIPTKNLCNRAQCEYNQRNLIPIPYLC